MAWQYDPLTGSLTGITVPNTAWVKLNVASNMYFYWPVAGKIDCTWNAAGEGDYWNYKNQCISAGTYLCVKRDCKGITDNSFYEIDLETTIKYYPNSTGIIALDGSVITNSTITSPGTPNQVKVYWPAKYPPLYIKKDNCTKLDTPPKPLYGDEVKPIDTPPAPTTPSSGQTQQTVIAPATVVKPQIIPNGLSDATYQDGIWNRDVTTKGKNHYKPYFFRDLQGLQDGKLNITIDYGPGSRTQNVIKSVYLRSVGVEMDASGNPIYEVYDLVARDVEEAENWTTPVIPAAATPTNSNANPVPGVNAKWSWDSKGKTIQEVGKMLGIIRGNGNTSTGGAKMDPYGNIMGSCYRKYNVSWDAEGNTFSPGALYSDSTTTTSNNAKDAFPPMTASQNNKFEADIEKVVGIGGKHWDYYINNKGKELPVTADLGTKQITVDGRTFNAKITFRQTIQIQDRPYVVGVWTAGVAHQYNWSVQEV